jgi:hypothetical protein
MSYSAERRPIRQARLRHRASADRELREIAGRMALHGAGEHGVRPDLNSEKPEKRARVPAKRKPRRSGATCWVMLEVEAYQGSLEDTRWAALVTEGHGDTRCYFSTPLFHGVGGGGSARTSFDVQQSDLVSRSSSKIGRVLAPISPRKLRLSPGLVLKRLPVVGGVSTTLP